MGWYNDMVDKNTEKQLGTKNMGADCTYFSFPCCVYFFTEAPESAVVSSRMMTLVAHNNMGETPQKQDSTVFCQNLPGQVLKKVNRFFPNIYLATTTKS